MICNAWSLGSLSISNLAKLFNRFGRRAPVAAIEFAPAIAYLLVVITAIWSVLMFQAWLEHSKSAK